MSYADDYSHMAHVLDGMEGNFLDILAETQEKETPGASALTPAGKLPKEYLVVTTYPDKESVERLVNAYIHMITHDCEDGAEVLAQFAVDMVRRYVAAGTTKGWYSSPLPGGDGDDKLDDRKD